jgi:hypothetical protein
VPAAEDGHPEIGMPSAAGCLLPRMGTKASLYSEQRCGPQMTYIGNFDASIKVTVLRKEIGQASMPPNAVLAQSNW